MLRPRSLLLMALALFPLSAIAQDTRAVQTVQSNVTGDGVELVGYHYANAGAQPIIMVHGLGSNIFSLDLPMAQHSMAQFLASRGYDVWVINLRGQGAGEIRSANPNDWNWSVDDYALRDVP